MVSASLSSRAKPVKLLKKGTETTKSHRFEPFSQRVSKLKIDPIHRVRRPGFEDEDGDETYSHFRSSLDHWAEMNLSEIFSDFVRSVNPLCESLHQILYHEDKIMALLAEYIEKRDHLSIEPLLNLLSQFARDLGVRFEKHFATSVTLVASVAASHPEVEVIEWSFTCLAWIFKFLSRLLVPDLRPLLNIMAPYLGKERQKPFVSRFAAESMSFLIRKAGLVYYKNKAPLDRAVSCLFEDIRNTSAELRNVDTYKEGLMVMFAEAIKGVKGGLHSNASDIFTSLMENSTTGDDLQRSLSQQVLCGVLTNVLHNTTPETFSELQTVLGKYIETIPAKESESRLSISAHLMFVCVTTRKATRVKEWKIVHQALLTLLQRSLDIFPSSKPVLPRILATVAYSLQLSPMDEMLPFMRPLMDVVADDCLEPFFLSFCSTFAEFGSERFHAVVLPYFQRFLTSSWKTKEADLCLSLLQLEEAGCITSQPSRPGYITCPNDWKLRIAQKLSEPGSSTEDVAVLSTYSKLYTAVSLSNETSILPQIVESLHSLLLSSFDSSISDISPLDTFTCGQGFKTYVNLAFQCGSLDASLWRLITASGARFARSSLFLEGTLCFLEKSDPTKTKKEDLEEFAGALIDNLTSPSHSLRLLSLKILGKFTKLITENDQGAIAIAIEIEESELTLQTARFLSMQIRKLGLLYPQIVSHNWFGKLVPKFCFGLFSKQLAQLWADSAETLKLISQHANGEGVVTELSMLWLQHDVDSGNDDAESEDRPPYTSPDFGCFNAASVEKIFSSRFQDEMNSKEALIESFNNSHVFSPLIPHYARARSLQVLHVIPEVAEKRSRQIVPVFLDWALREGELNVNPDLSSKASATLTSDDDTPLWSYKDRLALLGLFEKFINPRTLFKSSEVFDALLNLTAHGDSAVQKSALKALFTWKLPSIRPYQENLLNILDESRFREELAAFVRIEEDDSKIEKGHKADLLPILLRLLFGRMISKASSSGSGGQSGRRKAILRTLSHMSEPDFELFVQIAFGSLYNLDLLKENKIERSSFDVELVSPRRQSGLLKMVETMLETLQGRMSAYIVKSMDIILYILVRACRALGADTQNNSSTDSKGPMMREIRAVGVRCLGLVFSVAPEIDWTPYVMVIFNEVINTRLENFAIENAQGISGFHRLFHTWASFPKSVFYLTRSGSDVLSAVVETLNVPSARDEVKVYIMDLILQPIINFSTGRTIKESEELSDFAPREVLEEVLAPYIESILSHISKLLQSNPSRQVLVTSVETLSSIAPCVETSGETTSLIKICAYLLRQPQDKISPKTKAGLLHTLQHFIPLSSISSDPSLAEEVFNTVSSLYDYFKDDENRNVLSAVLSEFAKHDKELEETSSLCADLNALASNKLDEVDYDRRLQAFRTINEDLWKTLSPKQWRPILFNMLYHAKDDKELSIRSSSSFGIKRFIERVSDDAANQQGFATLRDDVLLPALHSGMRQRSEMVRLEFVSALGHLVKFNPTLASVQDMHGLLVAGDEEASFFNNILHIQQHRRMRALRRLATEASNGKIGSSNISAFFLPLIEHFIFNVAEDETAHNLAAEAVATIGGLGEWMEWSQFRAIFRRYRGNMTSKPELERNMARLLGRMTDALSTAFNQKNGKPDTEDVDLDEEDSSSSTKCRLASTLPISSKIATELTTHFLPFLTGFVHHKDEAQMSMRLPVAITTVKLLKLLPEEEMAIRLPSVLLDVCYILRSKSQDSRDTARKTLADIAIILGPAYFGYILKELKTALARGYQLHVLGFTAHSILVSTTDEYAQGALDHCLGDVVSVVMDDIFGAVGQEKDAEDYVSKMKEIKSNKSYDSMELLAKNSSVSCLGALVKPLQMLLREKLTASIVRKVDELFRRIGLGLLRNPGAESRDILVFCYEVIKESYEDRSENTATSTESAKNRRFLINMQGMKRGEKRGSTSSYLHKLPRFALDVLRSVLNKFSSLMTTANLSGFLPVIGDAVIQSHEEVKLSAMRLLSAIIKLPLPELDQNASTYLAEAVKVVKEAPSTNTEAAQAALKLIAAILRERKTVELRDNHLSYLLKRLTEDIEEPDRQGLTFNFIRAVMDRKFLVPELYDLVDNIARMMVTNQTRAARDLARGVYVHFLLEYPQAKSRWSKQLAFLAKNFDYQHREGRESVMEAVHRLLSKTGGDLVQDIISTFFLPVVLIVANDDTPECRQLAGLLLGEFFGRADKERLGIMLKPLHSWLEQTENKQLISTGLQAMRVFFESEDVEKKKESRFIVDLLPSIVQPIVEDKESEDWEVLYFALQLFVKICKSMPSVAFSKDCERLWSISQEALFFPHAWVKTCAANLVGLLFADVAKNNASDGFSNVPLPSKYGLELDKERMIQLTRGSIRSLQTPNVSEELAMQSVRNIVFLSRCFAENSVELSSNHSEQTKEDKISNEASEDEDGEEEEDQENETRNGIMRSRSPLHYIFRQVSDILRREIVSTRAGALMSKTASMALIAAICRHLDAGKLMVSLRLVLLPLQHLIDPNITHPRSSDPDFQTAYKSLVTNAQEILDLLQKKLGTTEYVTQVASIQENIRARRDERRVKRRIEAVADPEKFGREKKRKNDRKRFKRSERDRGFRDRRQGY